MQQDQLLKVMVLREVPRKKELNLETKVRKKVLKEVKKAKKEKKEQQLHQVHQTSIQRNLKKKRKKLISHSKSK
jgi:hypothetical protein